MIPINTFEQIPPFIDGVMKREIDLLVIESIGGLGKTYTVIDSVPEETREQMIVFEGHVTPLAVYMKLYNNPKKVVVFDDVDAMLKNKSMVAILKQVCRIGQNKSIGYTTTATYEGKPVPSSFISNNKVIILCNNISAGGADMKALLSRGYYLHFNPKPELVHEKLKLFAEEKDIVDYLGQHCNNIHEYNFRIYRKAKTLKLLGMDWKYLINQEYNISDSERIMQELKQYGADKAEREFMRQTGKPTSEYYKLLISELGELSKTKAKKKWSKCTTATQRTFYRYWNKHA